MRLAPFGKGASPQRQLIGSGAAAGVLSKMTVPRSRAGVRLRRAIIVRCRAHHHAPTADPTTPAKTPIVRFVTSASRPEKRKDGAASPQLRGSGVSGTLLGQELDADQLHEPERVPGRRQAGPQA